MSSPLLVLSAKRSQLGRIIMKRRMLLASAATMGVVFLAAPVNAQGVQQTVPIAKVDVQTVAAGYRASKVIGSSVLNEAGETIGKIDDLLVTRDGKEPYAVLSIGGFLDWAPTWWSCGMTASKIGLSTRDHAPKS